MAFGFLTASAYAVKIKGLEKRIQAFESGSALRHSKGNWMQHTGKTIV